MTRALSVLGFIFFILGGPFSPDLARAQGIPPVRIFVDEHSPSAAPNPTCDFLSGNPGTSPQTPLKGTSPFDGLQDALRCLTSGLLPLREVEIVVLCTVPTNGRCTYDWMEDHHPSIITGLSTGSAQAPRFLRGEPARQVQILTRNLPINGDHWHLEGFDLDGGKDQPGYTMHGAKLAKLNLLVLSGSHITVRNNRIHNATGRLRPSRPT